MNKKNTVEIITVSTPSELRGLLVQSAVAVLNNKITVAQANAVVGLSSEVHKSIKQEFEMRTEYAEGTVIEHGIVSRLLDKPE